MPEAGPCILIRVCEGDFIAERILLKETERMANPHVIVRLRQHSRTVKIRAEHDEEIRACPGVLGRRLILRPAKRCASEHKNRDCRGSDDHRMTSHRGSLDFARVPTLVVYECAWQAIVTSIRFFRPNFSRPFA